MVSYETALELPPYVLIALYESRARVRASERLCFVEDVRESIVGALGTEAGHSAFQGHMRKLLNQALGKDDDADPGYTKEQDAGVRL